MSIIERLNNINRLKFSLGKRNDFHRQFCEQTNSLSMYDNGFGLGIPNNISPANQLHGVFRSINNQDGIFAFNISGVNIQRASIGFNDYDEALNLGMITEWELSVILQNTDYLQKTIFHNGKVEFSQINNGIERLWN